ncbi:putative bifunctional diguanylate cyclase/phosphodiesterase [Klenkia marina]|uniref:putative bifunctional diguanylate cyclase/phosphodiesterase n=1 Tax=Klenkia marina TaxID=1960309 RepID=UPI001059DD92|nr:EAL domain-containing protein [Klenkia marina]
MLAVVALCRLLLPSGPVADLAYLLVVTGAAAVSWCAIARGGRAGGWTSAGVTLSATGDWLWQLLTWAGADTDVSVADLAYLASYLAIGIGLRRVLDGVPGSRFDRFVDTSAVFLVVVYLEWLLVLRHTVEDDALTPLVRTVTAAYPVLDAWLLALVVRLWFVRTTLRAEAGWVAAGATALFVSDLAYLVTGQTSVGLDVGWTLGALALAVSVWAAGAPVASPGTDAADRVAASPAVSRSQVALALAPLVLPGVVELVAFRDGPDVDPVPGILLTGAMVALAFARATRLLRQQSLLRRALELRARRASALAADSADALVVVDPTGVPLGGLGLPAPSALWAAVGAADPAGRRDLLERAGRSPGRVCSAELPGADGTWVQLRVVDRSAEPDVGGLVVTLQDVTDRRRMQDELAHQAFHDVLTGLANRALFDDRVTHALARTGRTGVDPTVLSLDLDGFKAVNDTLGHPAGDELLRQVATRLLDQVRPADTVARLGGDEFAVLLEPGRGDTPEDHRAVADRLLAALTPPFTVAGRTVRVGVSIGLATADPDEDPSTGYLLRDADTALYRAKRAGKARVVVFEPGMRAELELHTQLAADLPTALAAGQLRVVYQPVVDLSTGALQSFEALLRWEHPTLGSVSPAVFIPIAEESGVVVEIGRWVLQQACATAAAWRSGPAASPVTIAVNLSSRQLEAPGLVAEVADVLAGSGLAPQALCLELTETALVDDTDHAARTLGRLRELGVRIAVDDFGTGYSSLTHLRRFPIDVLKIDRSFVSGLRPGAPGTPIVQGLLELARVMGLDVVAEGVESEHQRDHLAAEGCRSAQGWLFSPALERAEADLRVAAAASVGAGRGAVAGPGWFHGPTPEPVAGTGSGR